MIIPYEIKELLKSDSVEKNLRIVFPNGEHADLINSDIVSESLQYTESVCSSDSLILGIMESPTIEFEVVNIPNIKGLTIKPYLEIFCSSSVSGAVQRADLDDAYVYPIPLGVFIVGDCKLQADLKHRVITAYSDILNNNMQTRKDYFSTLSFPWNDKNVPSIVDFDVIQDLLFSHSTVFEDTVDLETSKTGNLDSVTAYDESNNEILIQIIGKANNRVYHINHTFLNDETYTEDTFITTKISEYNIEGDLHNLFSCYNSIAQDIKDWLFNTIHVKADYEEQIINLINNYTHICEYIKTPLSFTYDKMKNDFTGNFKGPYENTIPPNVTMQYNPIKTEIFNINNAKLFNLKQQHRLNEAYGKTTYITENYLDIPSFLDLTVNVWYINLEQVTEEEDFTVDCGYYIDAVKTHTNKRTRVLTGSNMDLGYSVLFPRSEQNKKVQRRKLHYNSLGVVTSNTAITRTEYTSKIGDIENFRLSDMLASWAELQGQCIRVNRFGEIVLTPLKPDSGLLTPAETLVPSTTLYPGGVGGGTYFPVNYKSCWYDDLSVRKIGRIICNYKTAEGEQLEKIYNIVDDFYYGNYLTYIIGNNWILENNTYTEEQILEILEIMGNELKDAVYVPCEIEMQGRPDIEAGQFIHVITLDGDSFDTIIMRRTLKGIQALNDSIEVNISEDTDSATTGSGASSSSSVVGGYGYRTVVSSVNGKTGDVILNISDLSNDMLKYNYNESTKTLALFGFFKEEED